MASQNMKRVLHPLRTLAETEERIRVLQDEVQECRQLNLRLAEVCDVVMELLVPVADRDEKRLAELLERYRDGIGDPQRNGRNG